MEKTISEAEYNELLANLKNGYQYKEVEITSAEILALNGSPKLLVPGREGYVVQFKSMVAILDHGGTDYATQGDLVVRTDSTNTVLSDTIAGADLLLGAADGVRVVQALSADEQLDPDEGLELFVPTGDPTAGNGVLRVIVAHKFHATGL